MTNARKALGTALENRVVKLASDAGLDARRSPGSGIYREHPADAAIERLLVECKVRAVQHGAMGARYIYLDLDWLRGVQAKARKAGMRDGIVVVRPKGEQRLVALLDFEFLLELLRVDADSSAVVKSEVKEEGQA